MKNERPNIIYVLADDLGYGELGAYGQEKIQTPKIDNLAKSGMKFTQHYAGAPVCAPSRCVLLTGKHLGHAYVRGNDEWKERGDVWNYRKVIDHPELEGQRPIPDSIVTVGELLQGAGYKTAIIGKWGLGAPNTEGVPNRQGFDYFFGYNCQRQAHNYYPRHLWENDKKVIYEDNEIVPPGTKLPQGADTLDESSYALYTQKEYAPEKMQEKALKFIRDNKENHFFLYYASPIPHDPLQVPQKYVNKYRKIFGDENPYTGHKGYFPNRYPRAAYAGMISYLDDQVGELVSTLKDLGIYDNTLIIFTSDNGPTYVGGVDTKFFDSGKPFRSEFGRGKGFTYEGGIRVPMIASWKGHIAPGSESDHISAFYDVLPTFCDIAGIQPPKGTDGISFLPTLLGEKNRKQHEFLYWEFPSYAGQQAVRMGQWKAVRKNIFKGNLDIELYNLDEDITEQHNVASMYPDIVKKIAEIMIEEHELAKSPGFRIKAIDDLKYGNKN